MQFFRLYLGIWQLYIRCISDILSLHSRLDIKEKHHITQHQIKHLTKHTDEDAGVSARKISTINSRKLFKGIPAGLMLLKNDSYRTQTTTTRFFHFVGEYIRTRIQTCDRHILYGDAMHLTLNANTPSLIRTAHLKKICSFAFLLYLHSNHASIS